MRMTMEIRGSGASSMEVGEGGALNNACRYVSRGPGTVSHIRATLTLA